MLNQEIQFHNGNEPTNDLPTDQVLGFLAEMYLVGEIQVIGPLNDLLVRVTWVL